MAEVRKCALASLPSASSVGPALGFRLVSFCSSGGETTFSVEALLRGSRPFNQAAKDLLAELDDLNAGVCDFDDLLAAVRAHRSAKPQLKTHWLQGSVPLEVVGAAPLAESAHSLTGHSSPRGFLASGVHDARSSFYPQRQLQQPGTSSPCEPFEDCDSALTASPVGQDSSPGRAHNSKRRRSSTDSFVAAPCTPRPTDERTIDEMPSLSLVKDEAEVKEETGFTSSDECRTQDHRCVNDGDRSSEYEQEQNSLSQQAQDEPADEATRASPERRFRLRHKSRPEQFTRRAFDAQPPKTEQSLPCVNAPVDDIEAGAHQNRLSMRCCRQVVQVATPMQTIVARPNKETMFVLFTGFSRCERARLRRVALRLGAVVLNALPGSAEVDAPPLSQLSEGVGSTTAAAVRVVVRCLGAASRGEETGTQPRQLVAARTLHYLEAALAGCWTVSQDWVHASRIAGHWVPEVLYQVKGDRVASGGATQLRTSRKRGEQNLFSGLKISLSRKHFPVKCESNKRRSSMFSHAAKNEPRGAHQIKSVPSPTMLARLARRGGAEVLLSQATCTQEESLNAHQDNQGSDDHVGVACASWMLECISKGEVVPAESAASSSVIAPLVIPLQDIQQEQDALHPEGMPENDSESQQTRSEDVDEKIACQHDEPGKPDGKEQWQQLSLPPSQLGDSH